VTARVGAGGPHVGPAAVEAAAAIAAWPEVAEAVEEAREACTRLRWHQALRRRIPEAAAESRVRGASASGDLEGAPLSADIVRDLMRGAATWHDPLDPVEEVMKGVVAATAETERAATLVRQSPLQVLARLHTVAAAELVPADELGRPRLAGEGSEELVLVSPAPEAAQARDRLAGVVALMGALDALPVPVVTALVHAEVITARPFTRANGVVARALERVLVVAGGLDPTGVAVSEFGHAVGGGPAYFGALTAYARGDRAGVTLWLTHAIGALVRGAQEGERIADAVLAGRLGRG